MVGHTDHIVSKELDSTLSKGASMKVLIGKSQGWQDHVLRVIELEKSGFSPKHAHPWPHINYVIEGQGELMIDDMTVRVFANSYAFIPEGSLHQFRNVGDQPFKFICIVPSVGHK